MIYELMELLLPMLFMMGVGFMCRRSGMFSPEAVGGFKKLVANILLPLLLFKTFISIELTSDLIVVFIVANAIHAIALCIGYLTKRIVPGYEQYYPFLMTSSETGMIGYAMISMAFGVESIRYLALYDIGGSLFFYALFFPAMNRTVCNEPKPVLPMMLRTPILWGLMAGIVCKFTGLGALMLTTRLGGVLMDSIATLCQPVTVLMLFVVGYNITVDKDTVWPVIKTSFMRLAVMAPLCVAGAMVFDHFGLSDPMYKYAMYITFSLPASYMISIFAEKEDAQRFMSTQLSLHVFVSIAVVTALKVLA